MQVAKQTDQNYLQKPIIQQSTNHFSVRPIWSFRKVAVNLKKENSETLKHFSGHSFNSVRFYEVLYSPKIALPQ